MKYVSITLLLAFLSAAGEITASAASPRDQVAAHRYLLGTWHCTYTVGKVSGEYTTTWTTTLDDAWLRETYVQPPARAAMMSTDPVDATGFRAEYFMGYDPRHNAWVRFGAMTTGQYFAIRMTPTADGGWTWKYQTFFRRKRPETPQPDAVLTRKSNALYTIDGPTYSEAGVTVTEHHVCRKS